MKSVVIYSPDFNLCYSLLMYLQAQYKVIATTNFEAVSSLICSSSADLIIIDSEPTPELKTKCEEYKKCNAAVPLILTYVFNNKIKDSELMIKSSVNEIFYKPFDLNEITLKISSLLHIDKISA